MKKKELRREIRELRKHGSDNWLEALEEVRELKAQFSKLEDSHRKQLEQLRNEVSIWKTRAKATFQLVQSYWKQVDRLVEIIRTLEEGSRDKT